MIQLFINRQEELKFLNQRYASKNPEFIILYGRRRLGKTELIKEFIKEKPAIYFLADRRSERENLKELQRNIAEFLKDPLFERIEFENYIELFKEFAKKINPNTILVIDEFPYLIEGNKAITSIFQKIWDEHLKSANIFLILCGSSISMMETLMGQKNPLYGRRTGQWKLELLNFADARKFLPNYDIEKQIEAYSITDGIPMYLQLFDDKKNLIKNIEEKILNKGSFLYAEPEILLREELREPRNYFLILKAISFGNTKFGEIVNYSNLDKTMVSKYLDTLCTLHFVEKSYPPTSKKEKTRDTRYKLSDNFFRFWFRFVYPYKTNIEKGEIEIVGGTIEREFNSFIGKAFEEVCTQAIWLFFKKKKLPLSFNKIGNWWHKDKEIDIVALNEGTKDILFCECKWKKNVNAEKVLNELKEKAKYVEWNRENRKEHYAIFAKSFKEKTKEENVLLFDLKDMENIFKS